MNAQPIISRLGSRTIYLDAATLETLLVELRDERLAHEANVASESVEAEHEALIAKAEQIKQRTTKGIAKARLENAV